MRQTRLAEDEDSQGRRRDNADNLQGYDVQMWNDPTRNVYGYRIFFRLTG